MKTAHRTSGILIVAASLIAVTTACTDGGRTNPVSTGRSEAQMPYFDGPWASELASSYREAATPFERAALADGKILDAEFAEMEAKFSNCLAAHDITFTGFKADGSFDFGFPPSLGSAQANVIQDECSRSSGDNTIGSLYFGMQRNPQNLDEPTIIAACLVSKKVVPRGYDAKDYSRDAADQTWPFSSTKKGDAALADCSADPLGLLAELTASGSPVPIAGDASAAF